MHQTSELPEGWSLTPLSNCIDILDNLRVPVSSKEREKRVGNIPYYGATGQIGWIDDFIFNEELLLLGEDGAPFFDKSKPIAYIIQGKSWVNNHAHVLRSIKGVTTNIYLKDYLDFFNFQDYVSGTTRYKLNQGAMKKIPVPLPPLAEQHRIVAAVEALFSRLDAANERLERVPDILKRFRQAVLAAACDGRLTEEWRAENPDVEDNDRTNQLISPKKILESLELHQLPEKWIWTTVGKISSKIQYGISLKGTTDSVNGIPIFRMGNIQDGKIDLSDLKYVPIENKEITNFFVKQGDVLFNRTNSPELVGKCAVVDIDIHAVFASYLIRVECVDNALSPYLCWWINSPWGRQWARMVRTDGVSQSNINATKLKLLPIPLPPLPEQHEIVRRVDALFALADKIEAQVAAAKERTEKMRQSILAKAFSGELVETEAELARREGRDYEPADVLLERIKAEKAM